MEGETLPRFDSKSRLSANVKYPREHRIPGYTQRAVFFYLEMVTRWASLQYYTVLVYASVLVGAVHLRLSPYLRHIFAVKHIYLTLYIVYALRISPIYSVPPALAVRAAAWLSYLRLTQPVWRARSRACLRAWARAWPRLLPLVASFHSPIMYILRRYARLARRVVRSAHSAANFFEIVFKPSISVRLSSAGMGDAS